MVKYSHVLPYRSWWRQGFIVIVLLSLSGFVHAGIPPLDEQGRPLSTLAPMLDKATRAVVNIATREQLRRQDNPLLRDPFFRFFFGEPQNRPQQQSRPQALGSGVIIDAKKGLLITNNHVIDKADEISVTLSDGRTMDGELIGTDPEADIAVIHIPAENLTAMPLADSDKLRVGDFVVAIGNPFGLGQTVTSGIVSALGRSGLGIEGYEDFIQTDASINPGNSGGALVDMSGQLVGMNTAIIAPGGGNVGIGFAIPVNMAKKIIAQLIEYGEVRRGRLGIAVQALTPDLAGAFGIDDRKSGVVVTQIDSGSAAEKAGIDVGDVIVEVDGRAIDDVADLRNILGLIRVNEKVHLKVLHNGKSRTVTAVIAEVKQTRRDGKDFSPLLSGAVFEVSDQQAGRKQAASGIAVVDVKPGSPAWSTNLRPGDIITSINRQYVTDFKSMEQALKRSDRSILMNIQRGNMALFILIQ